MEKKMNNMLDKLRHPADNPSAGRQLITAVLEAQYEHNYAAPKGDDEYAGRKRGCV